MSDEFSPYKDGVYTYLHMMGISDSMVATMMNEPLLYLRRMKRNGTIDGVAANNLHCKTLASRVYLHNNTYDIMGQLETYLLDSTYRVFDAMMINPIETFQYCKGEISAQSLLDLSFPGWKPREWEVFMASDGIRSVRRRVS